MLIFLIILIFTRESSSNECCLAKNFSKVQIQILANFNSFNELKFANCNLISISGIKFAPRKKLILNSSLNFDQIRINSSYIPFIIHLSNLKGFELNSSPFSTLTSKFRNTNKSCLLKAFFSYL